MIAIVIIALLYLKQCNRSSNLNDELTIANMNQAALTDSVTTYKDKSGNLVYEKSVLIASEKELKDLNKELYDEVKDLKGKTKIVYLTTTEVVHDTLTLETSIVRIDSNSYRLKWEYDSTFSAGNFQKLSGTTTFDYYKDDIINPTTSINDNSFGISLVTGLKEGKDNYEIFIRSDYPGFTVTDIQGAIIDKKMIQSNESSVVFGPSIGYGLVFNPSGNVSHGVTVGFTATYNLNKSIKKLFRPYGL